MSVSIVRWPENKNKVEIFFSRPAFDEGAEKTAASVLRDIRLNGGKAIVKYIRRFDRLVLRENEIRVTDKEITAGCRSVPAELRRAVKESCRRISTFARAGMKKDWFMASPCGGLLGERFTPVDRVGVYVPGGAAPLVSTALMTVVLAKEAGVPEIVVCTPPVDGKKMNPVLLYALQTAGATEIYRAGGIQGIGLMAYGTRTVRAVRKIVGPGGTYVTAAKRQVYGKVALDLVAGPSEIAVLADESAAAGHVAADLLSQAEHGTGWEKALLVTSSASLAKAVVNELEIQVKSLSRRIAAEKVMAKGMMIVIVKSLSEGMNLCNRFAPEHLELMVGQLGKWLPQVKNAGAVFLGKWSPECTGDFVAGPSHVLPTGGAAAMFSGLTVDDFRKRISVIGFTRDDLKKAMPVIKAFGRIEGLDAHARSAEIRFAEKQVQIRRRKGR